MTISELITALQEFQEKYGDLMVVSTGYYGDVEVEELKLVDTTKWLEAPLRGGITVKGCQMLPGSDP